MKSIFIRYLCPVQFHWQLHDDKTNEAAKLYMAWNNIDIFILIPISPALLVTRWNSICDGISPVGVRQVKLSVKNVVITASWPSQFIWGITRKDTTFWGLGTIMRLFFSQLNLNLWLTTCVINIWTVPVQ